jgi:mannose-6-phosphate isomerase
MTLPTKCSKKRKGEVTIQAVPLFFHPQLKEKIWGGERLGTHFGKAIAPGSTIGESWELSAITNSGTVVATGSYAGTSLEALYTADPEALVGSIASRVYQFPLLIKFIDAHDRLSVQVHPDDTFARERFGEPFGKTECWYIADAGKTGSLAIGFKRSVTRDDLRSALTGGAIEDLLNIVKVSTGEVYFIPARTVHAILEDVVVYEVQQSSDTTLRLYDWMRTDTSGKLRPLHIDDAVAVTDLAVRESYRIEPLTIHNEGYRHSVRVACNYFALEEFVAEKSVSIDLEPRTSCRILTFLADGAELKWGGGAGSVNNGNTVLLPAAMGAVTVHAPAGCRFLMTTIPDLQTEIVSPLEEARFNLEQIARLGGGWRTVLPGDR